MFVHHTQLSSLAMLREMSAITFHPSLNPSRSMAASAQKTGNPMTNEMKDGNCALSPSLWHGSTRDFRLLRIVSRRSESRAFQSFPTFQWGPLDAKHICFLPYHDDRDEVFCVCVCWAGLGGCVFFASEKHCFCAETIVPPRPEMIFCRARLLPTVKQSAAVSGRQYEFCAAESQAVSYCKEDVD